MAVHQQTYDRREDPSGMGELFGDEPWGVRSCVCIAVEQDLLGRPHRSKL